MTRMDVSVVINLHREGRICIPTILSVMEAVDAARRQGFHCEVLGVFDRPDRETLQAAAATCLEMITIEVDFGDLACSRNAGVNIAQGKYVSFIDADDMWGNEWLTRCLDETKNIEGEEFVLHPRLNLYFERHRKPYLWVHPDMRHDHVDLETIMVSNRWTALTFAPASIYRLYPYKENRIKSGFGYEDWVWNLETARNGVLHAVAPGTVHCVRRKSFGSLLRQTNDEAALPNFVLERLPLDGGVGKA